MATKINTLKFAKYLMMLGVCVVLFACSEDIESDAAQEVTEDFVIEYYVANDVRGALHNTADTAKAKLEKELADTSGQDIPPSEIQKEGVKYKLGNIEKLSEYSYIVNWYISDAYGQSLTVSIKAVDSKEGWRILDFVENYPK